MSVASTYCDYNAGGPARPDVLEAFLATERRCPGNPASSHGSGRIARGALEDARERIANTLALAPADVVFTSGGTEAANLAVLGLGDPGQPVAMAPVEHPAVAEPAARRGVVPWSIDPDGTAVLTRPTAPVGLLCLVHGQSELGTLQPVVAAGELAAELRLPLLVDAAQTLGRVSLVPPLCAGAILLLSPHKAGGLRGLGVLCGRDLHRQLRPLLVGGGQELGLRPGTQSPALAQANALAIERAVAEQATRAMAMASARAALLAGIAASGVVHRVLTPLERSLPNTAMLHFPGLDGRNLVPTLDLAGVQASHGAACSSGAPTPPRVLRAIGLDDSQARACVRFSLGADSDPTAMIDVGRRAGAAVLRLQKKI